MLRYGCSTISLFALLVLAAPVARAQVWTSTTSEENGENSPAICEGPVSGLRCSGRYCDDVALRCARSNQRVWSAQGPWSPYFSEEDQPFVCPNDELVTGIRCRGRYCDQIAVRCERTDVTPSSACSWSAEVSDENGGELVFPVGKFLKGLRCRGSYCDLKSAYLCGAQRETSPGATAQVGPAARPSESGMTGVATLLTLSGLLGVRGDGTLAYRFIDSQLDARGRVDAQLGSLFALYPVGTGVVNLLAANGMWVVRSGSTLRATGQRRQSAVAIEFVQGAPVTIAIAGEAIRQAEPEPCLRIADGSGGYLWVRPGAGPEPIPELVPGGSCRARHSVKTEDNLIAQTRVFKVFFVPPEEDLSGASDPGEPAVDVYFEALKKKYEDIGVNLRLRLANTVNNLMQLESFTPDRGFEGIALRLVFAALGAVDPTEGLAPEVIGIALELADDPPASRAGSPGTPGAGNSVRVSVSELSDRIERSSTDAIAWIEALQSRIGESERMRLAWSQQPLRKELLDADFGAQIDRGLKRAEAELWRQVLPLRAELKKFNSDERPDCALALTRGSDPSVVEFERYVGEQRALHPEALLFVSRQADCGFGKHTADFQAIGVGFRNNDGRTAFVDRAVLTRLFSDLDIPERTVVCDWLRGRLGDTKGSCLDGADKYSWTRVVDDFR